MTSLVGHTRAFSLYAVPAAWLLCMAPHVYAMKVYDRISPAQDFDRTNPRSFLPHINALKEIDDATKRTLERAEAAQFNGFENLGFFAAGVVAANLAKVDPWWVNVLSAGYLSSRALFNIVYIRGATGLPRGAFYYLGIGTIITLYIKAGNALVNGLP